MIAGKCEDIALSIPEAVSAMHYPRLYTQHHSIARAAPPIDAARAPVKSP